MVPKKFDIDFVDSIYFTLLSIILRKGGQTLIPHIKLLGAGKRFAAVFRLLKVRTDQDKLMDKNVLCIALRERSL